MEVYEYYGRVAEDGHLTLPEELRQKLDQQSKIRIMLFVEDEEAQWRKNAAAKFFQGYDEEDSIYDTI
jgi:bifunctional DNA-binding transcriptional regulator/antitoxin component of YhaV-PrlF toxin-antitoxin module